ncbi:MAG: hypothetical protein ACRDNS_11855 [Trebonia sp.]
MATITIPRGDVTGDQICALLRREPGSAYQVHPDTKAAARFGSMSPGGPEVMAVGGGMGEIERAQLRVGRGPTSSTIQITPIGRSWRRLLSTFGIARKVRGVLAQASQLRTPRPGG